MTSSRHILKLIVIFVVSNQSAANVTHKENLPDMEERIERLSTASLQPLFDTPTSGFLVMEINTCSKCGRTLPMTTSYFHRNKNRKCGFSSQCKECLGWKFGLPHRISLLPQAKDGYKVCSKCLRELPKNRGYFWCRKNEPDGFVNRCKECNGSKFGVPRIYAKDGKKICHLCKEEKPYTKEYFYARNKKALSPWCKSCKDKKNKDWLAIPENKIARKQWEEGEYRERKKSLASEWNKNKERDDINYRIKRRIKSRIQAAIRYEYKSGTAISLLGCSIPEFKNWLEMQFTEGMTWDNYGRNGWHIDHIKPCAMFDLSDPKQQKECFHYTNIQPLWEAENIRKGAKYNGMDYKKKRRTS